MKKKLLLLLFLLPLLGSCSSLYADRKEVEQLRVVESLGLDLAPGGIRLSLASAAGPGAGKGALCFSTVGASVSDALDRLRQRSLEDVLFCGHLQHILLGESLARDGLEPVLAFVCRSSDARLDMPVYLLLDATAQEAMIAVGAGEKGISEVLRAFDSAQAGLQLSTAGKILRDLQRQRCALIRALRLTEAAEEEDGAQTLAPEGFGILVGGTLQALVDAKNAPAVLLLSDSLTPCPLILPDAQGKTVTLELQNGDSTLRPIRDGDGTLTGLEIESRVRATVQEIDGFDRVAAKARPGRAFSPENRTGSGSAAARVVAESHRPRGTDPQQRYRLIPTGNRDQTVFWDRFVLSLLK